MGITAENSLWYKGKSEVFREFKKSTAAILSAVASRNFSAMPGFAIEAFTDVEIDSKIKLTDYNQKIMSDAIDRELKTLGLENDISLKQATMAWELEKMQLFSDLQTEFADKELIRSLRGEEIDGLMIDQELREIAVLLSKIAIEIDIEDIKRQKEEVDLLPLPLENQLATAKLAAATRKLAVIPYILAALAAQRTAFDMEASVIFPAREQKANYDKETADRTTAEILPLVNEKAAAGTVLVTEQKTLLTPMSGKTAAIQALTTAQEGLISPMTDKAAATVTLSTKLGELITPMTNKATAVDNLTTALEGLSGEKTTKSAKLTALVAEEAKLIDPAQRKALAAGNLATAQSALITPMQEKATAAQALAGKLSDLFTPLLDKAIASTALSEEMTAQLANHITIATQKALLAAEEVNILEEKTTLMGKDVTLDEREVTIKINRAQLEVDRAQAKVDIASALQTQLGNIKTAMELESAAELTYIGAMGSDEVAVNTSYVKVVEAAKFAATKQELGARTNSIKNQSRDDTDHSTAMKNLNKDVKIAEKLIHLLA